MRVNLVGFDPSRAIANAAASISFGVASALQHLSQKVSEIGHSLTGILWRHDRIVTVNHNVPEKGNDEINQKISDLTKSPERMAKLAILHGTGNTENKVSVNFEVFSRYYDLVLKSKNDELINNVKNNVKDAHKDKNNLISEEVQVLLKIGELEDVKNALLYGAGDNENNVLIDPVAFAQYYDKVLKTENKSLIQFVQNTLKNALINSVLIEALQVLSVMADFYAIVALAESEELIDLAENDEIPYEGNLLKMLSNYYAENKPELSECYKKMAEEKYDVYEE